MDVTEVSEEWTDASLLARSSNRVHEWLAEGARSLPEEDRALFLGLVMGDDRQQPRAMVDDFRASGLAHLTAVSGQNVAFVLAVAGVVLRRLRPVTRLLATFGVIGWFVVMTRAEPSVIRAAVMAAASATCFAAGIRAEQRRLMPLLVLGALVIDPMLAHSVGFALSVGATFGLVWLSSPFARWCGTGSLSRGVATTLAAVCGTAPVSLLVFGRVPAVSLLCNPLAVPVAGAVMLLGIPVAVTCAALPALVASIVMFPIAVAVRLVWWIAHVGAAVAPTGWFNVACWLGVVVVLRRRAVAG
jgi:competence protein ComEC